MESWRYTWRADDGEHELRLVPVSGTRGVPYLFGAGERRRPIEIRDFQISSTPVTQALWTHVMGSNPAVHVGPRLPVENVSWEHVTQPGGFLDRINTSPILTAIAAGNATWRFRLPSEAEWEYAARGGPQWRDDYHFSGSNDLDEVGWYGPRFTRWRRAVCETLGWRRGWRLLGRFPKGRPTRTHDVALKEPNQLGLYDMSGNVWEWCEDVCVDDLAAVPADGTPYRGPGTDRRLRGGSHQNWDLHCTVWWRYGIQPDAHDGCLGFRIVLAPLVPERTQNAAIEVPPGRLAVGGVLRHARLGQGPRHGGRSPVGERLHGARQRHPQAAGQGAILAAIGKRAGQRVSVRLDERLD